MKRKRGIVMAALVLSMQLAACGSASVAQVETTAAEVETQGETTEHEETEAVLKSEEQAEALLNESESTAAASEMISEETTEAAVETVEETSTAETDAAAETTAAETAAAAETTAPETAAAAETTAAVEAAAETKAPETTAAPAQASQGPFVFQAGGAAIRMNENVAPILSALGAYQNYAEAPSCAFQGMDKIYSYPGFDLYTYPNGDSDHVNSIYFTDASVSTKEGIRIGSSLDEMLQAYGNGYTEEFGVYTYTSGKSSLSFIVTGGVIESIEYIAITN